MKTKNILAVCVIAVALSALSCDDAVNPKTDFAAHPILYGMLARHTQYQHGSQSVVIERLYDLEGLDPNTNTKDPTVSGAVVVLHSRFDHDTLREGKRSNINRYPGDQYYYYTNNYQMYPGDTVTITALLPGGERLQGSTMIPPNRPVEIVPPYAAGVTTLVNRFIYGDSWLLNWSGRNTEEHLFAPSMRLVYSKIVGDIEMAATEPVPLKYIQTAQGNTPVFPRVTYDTTATFDFDAMDATMAKISEGDSSKQRYKVLYFQFRLVEYDLHASRYYSSINGALDEFSIRIDETTYSNVSGGIGVVGAAVTNEFTFPIHALYARHFGYRSNQ
ncbi:MAG: DUF4249 family protein [Ignavibacteriae bacterium]|nr:DUF4249 family protein [Ignavibacteriota bacterium]